jgi:hypothetical protein
MPLCTYARASIQALATGGRYTHQKAPPIRASPQRKTAMSTLTSPTKQQIRAYLLRRVKDHTPPPSPGEIRRQLGWELTPLALGSCKL